MQQTPRFVIVVILLATLIFVLAGCGSSPKRTVQTVNSTNALRLHTFAIAYPLIRIGLVDHLESTLFVTASQGFELLDSTYSPVKSQRFSSVSFFIKGYDGSAPQTVYRVQVGSFSSEKSAEGLAGKLSRQHKQPAVTPYNSQTRTYRVQLGAFKSRTEAGSFQARLRGGGIKDSLIITERTPVSHAGRLNAINIDGSFIAEAKKFVLIPGNNGYLTVGGTSYRGAIELRIDEGGKILPINIIHLEDYLRGVVPAEMSSTVYPQIEALKAQTLAARTYAIKNMGQYSSRGFDICNTAACQVYKGMNIEQSMTDAAIEATRLQIITYAGSPINALFTSTSGGYTENVENVFDGDPVPYLRGVVSRPSSENVRYISSQGSLKPVLGSDGSPVNYYLDAARLAGFSFSAVFDSGEPAPRQLVIQVLERFAQVHSSRFSAEGVSSFRLIDFLEQLSDALAWRPLVESRVNELDVDVVFPEGAVSLSDYQKKAALYFLRFNLISPSPDGSLGLDEPLTNETLLQITHALMENLGALQWQRGNLIISNDDVLHLEVGRNEKVFQLDESSKMYQVIDGQYLPVQTIKAVAGDMIRVCERSGTVAILVHEPSTQGLTNDRFSKYHHWDIRYTMEELTKRVSEYVSIGKVVRLEPLRYGVSGRVAELRIIGTEGSAVFKGLRIRWVLGVRDTLFTMIRLHDDTSGQSASGYRFIGSGWGHGVGLCQVGAYGMALAGHTYDEIVKHFYTGVKVENYTSWKK